MKFLKTLIFATFIALSGLVSAPVTAQQTGGYSQAELDQMLAPIALYPDTVLSHVLIAATYPLEVVQAARWTRNNPGYSGQAAVALVENQDWDPSVKALVAFPELLDKMDRDISWTQGLGDAFLVQEGEVTDTIQYLRNQAYNNGQLQSNVQVNVVRQTRYIYIEPAQPQVVYVPYYDPRVVYGRWRWAAFPPVYWRHPPGFSVSLGFYWGIGYRVQPTFFFSSFFWPGRHVVVVDRHYHNRYRNYGYGKGHGGYRPGHHMAHYDGARRWKHSSQHRRGVSYRGNVNPDRFNKHNDSRSRDRSAPVRTAQVRGKQRYAADRSIGQVDPRVDTRANKRAVTQVDTLAYNTARDGGQRSRNSNSGRRPAPLDSARENGRASSDRAVERLRQDLADAGKPRRSNPQPTKVRSTQKKVERVSNPERVAHSQRSEPRQAAGKKERSNQSRGSRARERNSREP